MDFALGCALSQIWQKESVLGCAVMCVSKRADIPCLLSVPSLAFHKHKLLCMLSSESMLCHIHHASMWCDLRQCKCCCQHLRNALSKETISIPLLAMCRRIDEAILAVPCGCRTCSCLLTPLCIALNHVLYIMWDVCCHAPLYCSSHGQQMLLSQEAQVSPAEYTI